MTDMLLHVWNSGSGDGGLWAATPWQPRVDIYECAGGVTIHIEAPGLDEERLQLRYEANQLTVEGHKERPSLPASDSRCLQMEIQYGSFRRQLPLPADSDGENIEARYVSGVLTIHVPRRRPEQAARLTVRIN